MPAFDRPYEPPTAKLAFHSDKRYHVFLSFRGPDVRKTLVDHLFQALSTAGLNVYKDDENLEKGEEFWPSLEKAIKSSAIRIPIFSQGYAESTWCLKEAAAMLRSSGLIIPLFYDVEPTHVRYPLNESSPYKQAFTQHYGHPDRHPREEVEGWKDALEKICSRSGWSMDLTKGFEAQLVKIVVKDLIKTLDKVPLQVAKHPVGIERVKNLLIQKLNLDSMDRMIKVGIWGIGGIGKTTVAKAVYNQVYIDFEAACFVPDVRTTAAETKGLRNLQRKVLRDLSKYDEKVDSVDEGISLFRERLRAKRVLLILDDVDAIRQLNAFVGDWLGPGSRVIITSRNKHILNIAQVSSECIHEMSELEINESLELFSWHAFLRASPSPNYQYLSTKIVKACKGHPLSLEVIGSFLYDKQENEGCWIEALQKIPSDHEIHKTLYISYGALSDDEKEIFVDIACFFIGEHKSLPIVFWKSLYTKVESAVSNLSMKLLIKIDDEGVFDMHDHLRDMGRTIAEDEKPGTRESWQAAHLHTISDNNLISRLRLNGGNIRLEMLYSPGLRYLHLQNVHIEAIREKYRAIRKKGHSRFVGSVTQLKIMQLTNTTIHSLPPLFSLLNVREIQHMELRQCIRLINFPDTIDILSHLQCLVLRDCGRLNDLPHTIGNLRELQHLVLRDCRSLNNLPDSIGNLSQLQHLDLRVCGRLNKLPDSIGNLSQLQYLNLELCEGLSNLPDAIGDLSQLQHLDLSNCGNLNFLPDTIGNLSQLQSLYLTRCGSLNYLPYNIGNLSQLQYLSLRGCIRLNSLPATIGNLSQLQHLVLRDCASLNNLPNTIGNLSQLQWLYLTGCGSLNNLPNTIGNLSQLQELHLGACASLNDLPRTIGDLSQLQYLYLSSCGRLKSLPHSIGKLSQLQLLNLRGCGMLWNLPHTVGNLSKLQHLELEGCGSLKYLPDTIGNLSQLQRLHLGGCESLTTLPNTIANLSQLQHLDLRECRSLRNYSHIIEILSGTEIKI
ncbi:hypothetical protein SUGI_0604300 [Cryptomeria japonica]|nr:hypothetical protein SUGI_0604300 [Cryptomeria japonica]